MLPLLCKSVGALREDWGRGKVEIEIGDNVLTVERRSEKYTKRLKGEETIEAKTDVDFYVSNTVTGEIESLNGLDRNGTDKNIRKFFGTSEDFFLTSMASQLDSLSFIGEGSTKRKEILAKFLDLEIFERKEMNRNFLDGLFQESISSPCQNHIFHGFFQQESIILTPT